MKYLILFLLLSSTVFSKEITGLEKDVLKTKRKRYVFKWSFVYLSFGKPLMLYNNDKSFSNSFNIGYRKHENVFFYGLEASQIKNTQYKIQDIKFQIGYRPFFNYRIKPFLALYFGKSSLDNTLYNKEYNGYLYSLNLGIDVFKNSIFHIYSGFKINNYTYELIPNNLNSKEIYLTVGLEF